MKHGSRKYDRLPSCVISNKLRNYGVFVGVLFAFEFALPLLEFEVLEVVAGVVAGVAAGVGVLFAFALFELLLAGAGPHPPWHP